MFLSPVTTLPIPSPIHTSLLDYLHAPTHPVFLLRLRLLLQSARLGPPGAQRVFSEEKIKHACITKLVLDAMHAYIKSVTMAVYLVRPITLPSVLLSGDSDGSVTRDKGHSDSDDDPKTSS